MFMTPQLSQALDGADVHVLEGFMKIESEEHVKVLNNVPSMAPLLKSWRAGHFRIYGYETYKPIPGNADGTYYCNDMEGIVARVREYIVAQGGFDLVAGFSQGAEICCNLIRTLPELNARVPSKPVRALGLFSTRMHLAFSPMVGGIPTRPRFAPGELTAFICTGSKDSFELINEGASNLYDMHALGDTLKALGVETVCAPHAGEHEMPGANAPCLEEMRHQLRPLIRACGTGEVQMPADPPAALLEACFKCLGCFEQAEPLRHAETRARASPDLL